MHGVNSMAPSSRCRKRTAGEDDFPLKKGIRSGSMLVFGTVRPLEFGAQHRLKLIADSESAAGLRTSCPGTDSVDLGVGSF